MPMATSDTTIRTVNVRQPRNAAAENTDFRKRVSLACEGCRVKRIRCNGEQPRCSTCARKGVNCEYKHAESRRKPPSKRYVESLQARIAFLEGQLVDLRKMAGTTVSHNESLDQNAASDSETENDTEHSDKEESSSLRNSKEPLEELPRLAGRLNIGEDGQLHYFGAQSNCHLLHGPLYTPSTKALDRCKAEGLRILTHLGQSVDVPIELQDHMLQLYWKLQNSWLYLVDKESFMQDYNNGGTGPYCSPLLRMSIFALMARYSDLTELRHDPKDPETAGDTFADRAKLLLLYESEAPTVATVQSACLLSLRWMAQNKATQAWLYIGMATRMAYDMGLNIDCSKQVISGDMAVREVEIRKITWWACYKLDRIYSLALGRPGAIRAYDTTCAKPSLNTSVEFEPWVSDSPTDQLHLGAHMRTISAMNYSCDHLIILAEPLDRIYAPDSKLSKAKTEDIVARTDVAFNAFYNGLPSHLRLPASPRTPALPHIYQLHIQFHVMQIQLHRPLTRRRHKQWQASAQVSAEDDVHLKLCWNSAAEISRILRIYESHYKLHFAPVVIAINIFIASVIHLMVIGTRDETTKKHALQHMRTCVLSLNAMGVACSWCKRALRALRLLASEWLVPQAFPCELTQTDLLDHEDPLLRSGQQGTVQQWRIQDSFQEQPENHAIDARLPQYGNGMAEVVAAPTARPTEQELRTEWQQGCSVNGSSTNISEGLDTIDWLFDVEPIECIELETEFKSPSQIDTWLTGALMEPFSFTE